MFDIRFDLSGVGLVLPGVRYLLAYFFTALIQHDPVEHIVEVGDTAHPMPCICFGAKAMIAEQLL